LLLKAERSVSARVVSQDSPVGIQVRLVNAGPAVDELLLEEITPAPLQPIQGIMKRLAPLGAAGEIRLDYSVMASRGHFSLQSVLVEAREHFGLLHQPVLLEAPIEFQALPSIPILHNLQIRPRQTRGFFGPIPSRQSGSGIIFWGVREFHLGDTLRQINWKVSSRHPVNFFTNEFEMERIADIGLILDARKQTNLIAGHMTLFEYSVLATAALAEAFLADGHRVSMLIYGYGIQRVFPGYGKVQRERILQALAGAEPGSNFALENFSHLPTRLFSAQSQLVVISPVTPRDYSAYVQLRKNGYDILLVSPNPIDFEAHLYKDNPDQIPAEYPQALRLARLERQLWLRKLARLGIQVVDWPIDASLDAAMRTVKGQQTMTRRNPRFMIS
jgi:uncharacterized protein (DUF58 family)